MPEVGDLFRELEVGKEELLKTKEIGGAKEELGPHLIKLPRGAVAHYIELTPLQEMAWRLLGPIVKRKYTQNQELELSLLRAHMKIRPEEYIAYVWFLTIITGVVGVAMAVFFMGVFSAFLGPLAFLIGVFMFLLPVLTYVGLMSSPASRAKVRAKDIDKNLPAAMNFISALASANVNIDVIFKELSRQKLYGEIREEAEWITRDTELLGVDIITAIKNAAIRSPSEKFQEFLQGVVTTTTSGGQLKPYFMNKSEQYEKEAKLETKSRMETLGLMAETFVTVGVAFPLFLVIIMAIFAVITPNPQMIIIMLYMVVAAMLPGIQIGFLVALKAIAG